MRSDTIPRSVLVMIVGAAAGCFHGAPVAREQSGALTVTTDAKKYLGEPFHYARPWRTYRYRADIVTRIRNRSANSVFLARCYPHDRTPMFELVPVAADESWRNWGTVWACVGNSNPIEVRPGETRIDTLSIEGPDGRGSGGEIFGRLDGTFRIGLRAHECQDERCGLIDSSRFSNSFEVHPAVGEVPSGSSMSGCYVLGHAGWTEPVGIPEPPRRFRLFDDKASGQSVRPIIPLGDSSTALWMQYSSDSIVVVWRSGFSGYRLHLKPDAHGLLFGALEIFSVDVFRRERFTDAAARRVDCNRDHVQK
jgi:hypothetical protein